jgi:hypothetical protein
MRPVINLKRLNAAHLDTPHFCMETPQDVHHAIRAGDWAASIDLRDAYFHIPIHPEDILVLGSTFHNCMANLQKALSLLIEAGFIINWEKSSLIPTTTFMFLGMILDLVECTLSLPKDKLLRLRSQPSSLLDCLSCCQVMVLTGLVAAFHKAVPLLRLKGRFVQLSLNSYSSVLDLLRTVTLL